LEQIKQLVENRPSGAGHTLVNIPLSESQCTKVTLTLYRVPGRPAHLFSRSFPDQAADTIRPGRGTESIHTLFGLIEQQPASP